MKISIIMGSHRPESQSLKVAKYLMARLKVLNLCDEIYLLNLAEADIPFYDDGLKKSEGIWKTNFVYTMNFIWEVFFGRPFTKQYKDIRLNNNKNG